MLFENITHKFQLRRIAFIVSAILILVFLTSCGTKLEHSTVLSDTSCSPPCWQQIYPGTSTKQEVQSSLSSLSEVDRDSIRFIDTDNIYWEAHNSIGDFGGRITFVQDKVFVINFLHKREALTIEEVLNKFGDPDQILTRFRKGERNWLSVYLLYPNEGFVFLFTIVPFQRGDTATIRPDQSLDATWYFDPIFYDAIMTSGPIDTLDPEVLDQDVQPWTGYGVITYTEDD